MRLTVHSTRRTYRYAIPSMVQSNHTDHDTGYHVSENMMLVIMNTPSHLERICILGMECNGIHSMV